MEENKLDKYKVTKQMADEIVARIEDVKANITDGECEISHGQFYVKAYYDAVVDVRSWHEEWSDPYCWVSFQEIRGYDVTINKVEVYDWDTDTTHEDDELFTMINDEFGQ